MKRQILILKKQNGAFFTGRMWESFVMSGLGDEMMTDDGGEGGIKCWWGLVGVGLTGS